jgi:(4-alkanoyl-5-oxo-2,5-dihydrofuran-3-yl)methyl phosphate reductase
MESVMVHLIAGATGNIGSLVVERLLERGDRPRVFVRDAGKARARYGNRVDVVVGDLTDAASLLPAFAGADTLFLVSSGHDLDVHDAAAARGAKAAGVGRLVKLSSIDAEQQNVGTGVWHARGEAAIRASGITFTFVRPSGFMSNALYWARSIKADGVVRACTGDGRIPFIHPDDIADVAIKALTTRDYDGAALSITGPEALSYAEMTEKIGAAIGKALGFRPMTDEDARQQQIAWGAPEPMVEARLSIFRAIREGRLATVTDTVERVLGRGPVAFERWAEQNVESFR